MRNGLTAWVVGASIALGGAPLARAEITTWIDDESTSSINDADSLRVICPVGSIALGGGIDTSDVFGGTITSNAPAFGIDNADRLILSAFGEREAPTAWQSSARSGASISIGFKVAAICATEAAATTVVAAKAYLDPDTYSILTASCPEGSHAIGGGVDVGNIFFEIVSSDGPIFGTPPNHLLGDQPDGTGPAPDGWGATVANLGGAGQEFTVAAICSSDFAVQTVIDTFAVAGDTFGGMRLQCPAGTHATGGGLWPESLFSARVTSTGPAFGSSGTSGLYYQPVGEAIAPTAWEGYVLNESASPSSGKIAAVCVPESGVLASALAACAALAVVRRRV